MALLKCLKWLSGSESPLNRVMDGVVNRFGGAAHSTSSVDLDRSNYERFLDVTLTRDNNITTGKIYQSVLDKEGIGDYLGKTIQVVPHINAIKTWIESVSLIPVDGKECPADVYVIELGGTVGDSESMPFIEALRQLSFSVGKVVLGKARLDVVVIGDGWQWAAAVVEQDVERWKLNGPDSDDLPAGQEKCFAKSPPKRKAAAKSSRDEATHSQAENVSPLRKKPRFPYTDKTPMGSTPSSSARAKHLMDAYSTKVGGMCDVRGVLPLKYPTDKLRNCNLPCREVCSQTNSPTERQRNVDIPLRSSSRLHQSRDIQVACTSQGTRIGLGELLFCLTIVIQLLSHEQSNMELIQRR
ncbi:uncharacterized protein LOC110754223 [Prunus avium]|uniref:Uncharacterized protein LOC110754223 n=1 Tax=Prunus avium TaxID=42229 RepID=A0A6P5SAY3_PRUAV|nr:uncharacterized protein LOC110754223 [Prunus avium]